MSANDSGANPVDPQQRFTQMYLEGHAPWDSGVSPPELLASIQGPEALPPGRALDIGCGIGTNSLTLALAGWRVLGVDFAEPAIVQALLKAAEAGPAIARAGGSVAFAQADVTRLTPPAPEERVNLLLDIGCLNGIPSELRPAYAQTMASYAAPGALFLLYAHLPRSDGSGPLGCTPDEIDTLFAGTFRLERREMGTSPQGGDSMLNWLRRV